MVYDIEYKGVGFIEFSYSHSDRILLRAPLGVIIESSPIVVVYREFLSLLP